MRSAVASILLVGVLYTVSGCRDLEPNGTTPPAHTDRYLVGAHYYLWFPSNFGHGTLRQHLRPRQRPVLGRYASTDPRVAEQHIAWCSRYGIDFLTLDWWPDRPEQNAAIEQGFLKARNLEDIRFCIFFETWDLGFNPDYGCTHFTTDVAERFVTELLSLTERFFDHPSYLHVQGRPVLILYLSRTLTGAFDSAIETYRKEAHARGYNPFLIGDEVFWQVSPLLEDDAIPFPLTPEPQRKRIACFDAITAYNMYENGKPSHAGYGADSLFFSEVADCYTRFRAADPNVAFIPGIIPGYNDRGVRPSLDHFVIPRRLSPAAPGGSFFASAFEQLAFPFSDPSLRMILLTSFNEWNEDTAIEPLLASPPSTTDDSDTQQYFSQGYRYEGFGTTYLEVIRDKVVALAGRVTTTDGAPVHGHSIAARQGSRQLTVTTDHNGYYRVPRGPLRPGPCRLRCRTSGVVREARIDRERTTTGLDFAVSAP